MREVQGGPCDAPPRIPYLLVVQAAYRRLYRLLISGVERERLSRSKRARYDVMAR